jgi:RNA polymerase sigma factor (sigma-70 family)
METADFPPMSCVLHPVTVERLPAMSHPEDSVTQWIAGLKAGDEAAAAKLWQRYYRRLLALARKKLGDSPRRVADEEDVVISVFRSFFQRAQEGRFPNLHDRDDLWHVIVRITERKAYGQVRDQTRQKRGSGLVGGESAFVDVQALGDEMGINEVAGPEPTPEFAAEMVEAVERLFDQLADAELRQIALHKLEGYTNEEIAGKIGRSLPTVERRLRLIREKWRAAGDEQGAGSNARRSR